MRIAQNRGTLVERFADSCEVGEGDLSCARATVWAGAHEGSGSRRRSGDRVGCSVGLKWSCARVRAWKRAGLTRSQDISLYPSIYHSTPTGGRAVEEDRTPMGGRAPAMEEESSTSAGDRSHPMEEEEENSILVRGRAHALEEHTDNIAPYPDFPHSQEEAEEGLGRGQSKGSEEDFVQQLVDASSDANCYGFPLSQLQSAALRNFSEGVMQPSTCSSPDPSPSQLPKIHTTEVACNPGEAASNSGEVARHSSHVDSFEGVQRTTFIPSTGFQQTQKHTAAEVASNNKDVARVDQCEMQQRLCSSEIENSIEKTREDNNRISAEQSNLGSNNMCIQNLSDLLSSMSVDEDISAHTDPDPDLTHPLRPGVSGDGTNVQTPPNDRANPLNSEALSSLVRAGHSNAEDGYYLENLDGFENEFVGDITELSLPCEVSLGRKDVEDSGPDTQGTGLTVGSSVVMPHFKPPSSSTPFRAAPSKNGTRPFCVVPSYHTASCAPPPSSSNTFDATSFSTPTHSNRITETMECGTTRLTSDSTRMDDSLNPTSSWKSASNASFAAESSEMEDSTSTRLGSDWGSPEPYVTLSPVARELPAQTSAIKSILKSRNRNTDSCPSDSEGNCDFVTPRRTNKNLSKSVTFKLPLTDSSGDFGSSTGSSILALETPEHLWCALPSHHVGRREGEGKDSSEALGRREAHPIMDSSAEKCFQTGVTMKEKPDSMGAFQDLPALEREKIIARGTLAQECMPTGVAKSSQPWDGEDSSFDVKIEHFFSQKDNHPLLDVEEGMSILAMETPAFMWASPPINFIDGTFN